MSIHQPQVRPIIRGKQKKPVEFGVKLSVSLTEDGISCVDLISWDAFHEGGDLTTQVEAYRKRFRHYPEVVLGAPIYGTRENRKKLKEKGIRPLANSAPKSFIFFSCVSFIFYLPFQGILNERLHRICYSLSLS